MKRSIIIEMGGWDLVCKCEHEPGSGLHGDTEDPEELTIEEIRIGMDGLEVRDLIEECGGLDRAEELCLEEIRKEN